MIWVELMMIWVIVPALTLTVVMCFLRLLRGPSLPDRIVAVDMLSAVAVGMMAAYAVATENSIILDVALVVALITFLGTIGFAYYIDRRRRS